MDLSAWVVYTLITALVMAASVVHYRVREPGGRGRTALAVMRGTTLGVLVLLLFDPEVPAGTDPPVVALVDASLSMSLPLAEGGSRWDRAREAVAAVEPDRIQLFGTTAVRTVPALEEAEPVAGESRLGPALRSAVEAGAGRLVVVSDGALDDPAEVRTAASTIGVPVEVVSVGGETRINLAVTELDVPSWLEAGEEAVVRVSVGRVGEAGTELPDSAMVTLMRDGRSLARASVAVPPAGRTSPAELRFSPEPGGAGPVRLDARLSLGGSVPDDDVRSVYVRIAEEPAEVALVSLRPDQEPRFLLPVLERALGVPVRGWIGLDDDRFLRIGTGSEAGVVTAGAAVRRAVENAGVVVLHGIEASAAEWVRQALARSERLLVFPADPAPELPIAPGPNRSGDWYLSEEVPASPVAPLVAGMETEGLPPLSALRPTELPAGYWTPLTARLARRGPAEPVAAVGREDRRRVAVALGDGYWRWAFSGPAGRDVYERVWSAVGGWLLEDLEGLDREAVRPVSRIVERGGPVRWVVTAATDSVRFTIHRDTTESGAALDTTVAVADGRALTPPLPPGHYRYAAAVPGGERVEGALTVEAYSPELLDAVAPLDGLAGGQDRRRRRGGRPLHTTPWPYVLIVALLCGEWALRRRWGLR